MTSISKNITKLIALILAIYPCTIQAQTETTQSLQQCIDMAMQNNPTMQSGKIKIQKAQDLQGTAYNIAKTNFILSQDPTEGGGSGNTISLNQEFDFPTIYAARKKLLKAETNLEQSNLEVTRNQLIMEISKTYHQLLYQQENKRILEKQDSIYAQFLYLANAKLQSGESGRLEQMNAQRLYDQNKIELQNAQKEYQNTQLILQKWINTENYINPLESKQTIIQTDLNIHQFDPQLTPIGKLLDNQIKVSQRNLEVTQQGYLPGINLALKNQLVLKWFNPYNVNRQRYDKGNFMGFDLGISIPLFFGEQRAKTKAAKRDIALMKMQQTEAQLAIRNQYQTYLNEYTKARKTLDYYLQTGNNQANEIARISQLAYQQGEINYIEYIQNMKTAVDINLQYTNAVNDYNQTIIQLNYLQGNK